MKLLENVKLLSKKSIACIKNHTAKNTPETLIAEAEGYIEKSKRIAGKQLMAIQELTGEIKKELKIKEAELIDLQECINQAISLHDKELLVSLLLDQEIAENAFLEQKRIYDNAVSDAVKISDNYKKFEHDINAILKNLENLKTRAGFLKMREKITFLENKFEQQTLMETPTQYRPTTPTIQQCSYNIIKQNSSRKKALEQADALLQIGNPQ